jgi:hypothetical protein
VDRNALLLFSPLFRELFPDISFFGCDLLVKKWLPGVKEKRQLSSVHVAQELEAMLSDVASGIATPGNVATGIQKAIEESRQQLSRAKQGVCRELIFI